MDLHWADFYCLSGRFHFTHHFHDIACSYYRMSISVYVGRVLTEERGTKNCISVICGLSCPGLNIIDRRYKISLFYTFVKILGQEPEVNI